MINAIKSDLQILPPSSLPSRAGASLIKIADNQRLSTFVRQIITEKKQLLEKSLSNTRSRYHPITGTDTILISGDVFTTGYMMFEGAKSLFPTIAKVAAIGIATSVCGFIGGGLNIAIGLVCLKEGIQALRNKDYLKAGRLINGALWYCSIGVIMILATLSMYVAIGGIGAILATHPWILPILFLLANLPLIYEVLKNVFEIWSKNDIPSTLQLNKIQELLDEKKPDWDEIFKPWDKTILDLKQIKQDVEAKKGIEPLIDRMEILQANSGARCAIQAFKLFEAMLDEDKDKSLKRIKKLKGRVASWNKIQHIRLAQQILYIVSFTVSMVALRILNPRILIGIQDFAIAVASAIPFSLDTLRPLERNTPLVIPKASCAFDESAPLLG